MGSYSPCPVTPGPCPKSFHSSLEAPAGTGRGSEVSSQPGWTAPTLSACLHWRGAPALWASSWPSCAIALFPITQRHIHVLINHSTISSLSKLLTRTLLENTKNQWSGFSLESERHRQELLFQSIFVYFFTQRCLLSRILIRIPFCHFYFQRYGGARIS